MFFYSEEIQLVGMSATLSNISDLCSFLNAEVYTNNFRPVALREYIKLEKQIYNINNQAKCVEEVISKSRVINFPVCILGVNLDLFCITLVG